MQKQSNWRPDLIRDGDDDDQDYGPSKTQVKAAMHELQTLGLALMELPLPLLGALEMEDRLREGLAELRRLTSREAIRRQSQFIGKLLREADAEPFRRAIDAYRRGQSKLLQEAESWRERLLADDEAVTDWIARFPDAAVQPLRALIRNTRREQQRLLADVTDAEAPVPKGRLYRELFQVLRAELQAELEREFAARAKAAE